MSLDLAKRSADHALALITIAANPTQAKKFLEDVQKQLDQERQIQVDGQTLAELVKREAELSARENSVSKREKAIEDLEPKAKLRSEQLTKAARQLEDDALKIKADADKQAQKLLDDAQTINSKAKRQEQENKIQSERMKALEKDLAHRMKEANDLKDLYEQRLKAAQAFVATAEG